MSEVLIRRLAESGVTGVVIQDPAVRDPKHSRRVVLPSSSSMRAETVIDLSRVIEHSCQCGSAIAIHPLAADVAAAAWICKICGAAYFGGTNASEIRGVELLAPEDSPLASGDSTTRLDESMEMETDVSPIGSEIDAFTGKDRRREKRHCIGVPVIAVPLLADFSIAGPAARMTTRDISKNGIALAHTRFSDVPYYAIDFTVAGIELLQVLLKVLRVSNSGPGYEIAGRFIERVRCANWHGKCS